MQVLSQNSEVDRNGECRSFEEIPYFDPSGGGEDGCSARYAAHPTSCFIEAYRKLGPIFRCRFWGIERVAIGGTEANILSWGNKHLWNYHRSNRIFREQFSKRYLNQLRGREYTRKRIRINQGFKPSLLLSHAGAMGKVVTDEIRALPSGEAQLRLLCMRLMICMTSRVLLQQDLPKGMDEMMALSNKEMLKATSLGRLRWLWYMYPPKRWRRRRIFSYLNRVLDERERNPVERDDILSVILNAHPSSLPPLPRYELVHDLSQLFMAGSTTTSLLMTWALLFIFQDAAWLAGLRTELAGWDASTLRKLDQYPRLWATALEIERLKPPVPVFNRVSAQEFSFQGYRIPEGHWVLHLQTLCHFLDEVYEEPFSFRPQRFLDNPNLPAREVHGTYGGGEHVCVGFNLARIATCITVASIVTNYEMEYCHGPPSMEEKFDVGPVPVEGDIRVRFVPRSEPENGSV